MTTLTRTASSLLRPGSDSGSRSSFFQPEEPLSDPAAAAAPINGIRSQLAAPAADPKTPEESTIRLPDGTELFYRSWLPRGRADRALFLFHRGHEHSGRLADVVRALDLENTAVFAWDARGHGRSPGPRGHARSFAQLVRDLDYFVNTLVRLHDLKIEDTVVLGQSAGAVVAAAWIHDFAPPVRGMVLVSPAFRIKLYVPFAIPGLRLWRELRRRRSEAGKTIVRSFVSAGLLTSDPEQMEAYRQDPLITRDISVPVLLGLHDAGARLVRDAGAFHTPTLILSGSADRVVHRRLQRVFFQRVSSTVKEMKVFPGMRHDILHEKKRGLVLAEIRGFFARLYDHPPTTPSLLTADLTGASRDEFDRLSRPLPPWSPKRWQMAIASLALSTVGKLSDGIRLGWEAGFDSGRSLDYVYRNQPQGRLGIGRWIDRWYLSSPGWRGIRQRRENLAALLRSTVSSLLQAARPVRILDVAAGPGRYVLDLLSELRGEDIQARLRDWNLSNLEAGRALTAERGLDTVVFEKADAFDVASLLAVDPAPNLAVVSGLFELFPDNPRVLASLKALGRRMAAGGYLIYTNQPWHPQQELIARVLTNRDKVPWVMRCRSQAEMDELVSAAGFKKLAMAMDDEGIFTVSLARIGAASEPLTA
ncbi:MAG: bifunctional alpha/beta hydrolase/class I SAM-dependent methyltransferase [Acidobacteria bacterium]|nr:bifunctional alpha/beta hydrolase/class I SAM-dependent methyltransferase [Acidobacteriota bacterium]